MLEKEAYLRLSMFCHEDSSLKGVVKVMGNAMETFIIVF